MQVLSFDDQVDVGYVAYSEGESCPSCGRFFKDGHKVRIRRNNSETFVVCEPACKPKENAISSEVVGDGKAA